jgi:hypothetical protein
MHPDKHLKTFSEAAREHFLPAWAVAISITLACLALVLFAHADTPGKHGVILSWTASTTAGVTYNVYRGTAAGVCSGTPTPYATGITSTTFTDTANLTDGQIIFYNTSAVKGGAESACDGELQVQIPVLPAPPSGNSATAF